jgi:predicted RNA-binding protein
MCEATAVLTSEGRERTVMENVIVVHPEEGHVLLANLLGEQKVLRAKVKNVDFLHHRILLEELPADSSA